MREGDLYEGRYLVVRTLGEGGFGQTFVAQDKERGEEVVLKTLRMDRAEDWKSIELFEREAKVLERLDHPGIPSYIDWFEADSNAWCLVQRMARGETIAALVESGWSPTEAEVVGLACRALEILVYLQERHPPIVHRDIKPENVLVDGEGGVSLVDFGSVKSSVKGNRGSTVAGTFGYMAPEQLRGVASARTDLFGLGATLLHLMTARQPEDLPTARLKIAVNESIPDASQWLRGWFDRMIDPIEEERFADAAAALRGLKQPAEPIQRAEPPEPAEPAPPSTPAPSEPLPRRAGAHEELDALGTRRRRILGGFAAVLILGVLVHAFGKGGDDALMMLAGAGVMMPVGALGVIAATAQSMRTRGQQRIERLTGRRLPVSERAWVSVAVTEYGEGGPLAVRRRLGVLGKVMTVGPAAFFAWFTGLTAMTWGWERALETFFEMLVHPAALIIGGLLMMLYPLWRYGRPSFRVTTNRRWTAQDMPPIEPGSLESWRVVTREHASGEPVRVEVRVLVKRRGALQEEEAFKIVEATRELAMAQARLLHELIEEQMGGAPGPDAAHSEDTGVVFDHDAASEDVVAVAVSRAQRGG